MRRPRLNDRLRRGAAGMTGQNQPHRLIAILGHVGLVVALPIALFGLMPANEYTAWGGAGIDCDGPGPVLLFSTLGLAIYGAGAVLNGRHFRKPLRLLVAGTCMLVCLALMANIADAVREQRVNDLASDTCG
ncbi:hypothetical protein AA2016_0262 [Aminobacter aminovorans]|uniref:Transmembrane protein n=3 Tax=Aminobacter TaxID=31988 RepID=A0AAC8YJG8_AMIAI|nr:hypothetical protein AA2016_0262 [Aminobacter aminovorans]